MSIRPPAEIGMSVDEVDTPALLIDLDAFERNLRRLPEMIAGTAVRLRPHSKTHKSPVIALKQMELGAVGVCCQKVSEAEAMVQGGVPDVLVSNEIVGRPKLRRLAALARHARVAVCADDPDNVADLDAAAAEAGVRLGVLVEIDVGARRCGVDPGEPALALAQRIAASPHLRFAGLQSYQGRAQHVRAFADRRTAIAAAVEDTRRTVDLLERHGLACEIVGGAGTGTFRFEAASGVYNELQAGSYIFMDADYGRNLDESGAFVSDFENSLFILATVMSKPARERAVVDAGLKAMSTDSGLPLVAGLEEVRFERASDEHGVLAIGETNRQLRVGDKIRLIPGHCDPTVNAYDWYVGVRNERVETIWPVAARGALL